MRMKLLVLFIFALVAVSLMAVPETEPNNLPGDTGVTWCDNGTHTGFLGNVFSDNDWWTIESFPGDELMITILNAPPFTRIAIFNSSIDPVISNLVDGVYQSQITYTVPDGSQRYLLIQNDNTLMGDYSFSISGQFIGVSSTEAPSDFNIPPGATGVDPDTSELTWRWGDGSWAGSWNIMFGLDPNNLSLLYPWHQSIDIREGSYTFPAPLAGGLTYYYSLLYKGPTEIGFNQTPLSSFTTAPRVLPVPFYENFETEAFQFASINGDNPWMRLPTGETPENYIIGNINMPVTYSFLIETGSHNLAATTGAYLSFKHLCLMDAENDHGYVLYSTDGGQYFYLLPESSYMGSGAYNVPLYNDPFGPCFDSASYPEWVDMADVTSLAPYIRTETFDLSPWAGTTDFRLCFLSVWDNNDAGRFWIIDDVQIQLHSPGIPHSPSPVSGTTGFGTYEALSWTGINSTSYEIMIGTSPGTGSIYPVSSSSWLCDNLNPSTPYYWQVRGINSVGVSEWSPAWSFTTQAYSTSRHTNSSLYINRVDCGSISNQTAWNSYTYYPGLSTSVTSGSNLPLYVYLTGGYGPEGIRVWVDLNQDNLFNNTQGEYWDLTWNGSGFSTTIPIPQGMNSGYYRMRIQCIHTNSQSHNPSGVLTFGETEDYILHILAQPILGVNPPSTNFPATLIGFSSESTRFTLSNIGGSSLMVTLVDIIGDDADCFVLSDGNSYPITLSTNQAWIDISYHPLREGNHSASLLVKDNLTRTDTIIPLAGTAITCVYDGAVAFDGSGEYLSIASAPPLQNLSAVTLETWFKWNGNSSIQFLTAKYYEELEIHTTMNNGLRFIPTTQVYLDSPAHILSPGTWQHIACVYDPATLYAKMYIDGVEVSLTKQGNNPMSQPLQSTTIDFRIGLRMDNTYALAGCVDEFRIWNSALSLEQIRNNMHLWQSPDNPALALNLRLDEASGTKVWNQKGSMHGALNGSEPTDRIQSEVLIGAGSSHTLTPAVTGVPYTFTNTGMQITFSEIVNPAPITVTRLNGAGNRQALDNQSWITHTYNSGTYTASLRCTTTEDLDASSLPAYKYRLYTRSPLTSGSWQLTRSASDASVVEDWLLFADVNLQTAQHRISWEDVALPPAPTGLGITRQIGNVRIDWNAVDDASGYKVYSSDNPGGPFTPDLSGTFDACSWTAPISAVQRFYRVVTLMP